LPRYLKLLAFLAAMHSRTPSRRDHFMGFWSEVLQMGEEIEHQMKVATPEERRRVASYAAPDDSNRPTMSLDDVRKIRANPMQHTLEPLMAAEFPLLTRMRCFVLCTASEIGFITSVRRSCGSIPNGIESRLFIALRASPIRGWR
jgi:hypothetical protein